MGETRRKSKKKSIRIKKKWERKEQARLRDTEV
jgi:hypothetical protein